MTSVYTNTHVLKDEDSSYGAQVEMAVNVRVEEESDGRKVYKLHVRIRASVDLARARVRHSTSAPKRYPSPRELTLEIVPLPQTSAQLIDARPWSRVEDKRAISNQSICRAQDDEAAFDAAVWHMSFFEKKLPISGAAPAWDVYATFVDMSPEQRPLMFDLFVTQRLRRTLWQTVRSSDAFVSWSPVQVVVPVNT